MKQITNLSTIRSMVQLTPQERELFFFLLSLVGSGIHKKSYKRSELNKRFESKSGYNFLHLSNQILKISKKILVGVLGEEVKYQNLMLTVVINKKEETIFIEFNPYIVEAFSSIKNNFEDLVYLNSYAFYLYLYLFATEGSIEKEIDMEELRNIFDIDDKYQQYGHLKSKVLLPAVKEINENTNLKVEFLEQTQNKKVIGFVIKLHSISRED